MGDIWERRLFLQQEMQGKCGKSKRFLQIWEWKSVP